MREFQHSAVEQRCGIHHFEDGLQSPAGTFKLFQANAVADHITVAAPERHFDAHSWLQQQTELIRNPIRVWFFEWQVEDNFCNLHIFSSRLFPFRQVGKFELSLSGHWSFVKA